jgi:hypothetical protein
MLLCIAALATLGLQADLRGQDRMRTGDGLLQISTALPAEIRVGEQFNYTIAIENTSDNIVLHDVVLKQTESNGFSIESTSVKGADKQDSQKKQEMEETRRSSSQGEFTVAKLEPGEVRTIQVKAAADKEGTLKSCLQVVSYLPSLCLTANVVKPELQLTKNAPKQADRCNAIEITYMVKNDGSGDVGTFQIVDDLGDGLKTIEGNSTLKFDVDGLDAGETRKFVARVFATKTGEFSSRAVAKAENSDLKSRSQQTTTKVIAADLVVKVDGPGRLYGDQIARFSAKITNTGNTVAKDVAVGVMWPEDAALVDIGEYNITSADDGQDNSNQSNSSVASNNSNQSKKADKSAQKKNKNQPQMDEDAFVIESLAPGQTASFDYALRPGTMSKIPTKVEAIYVCTVDAADDVAEAENRVTSIAMAQAEIVRLPALQMVVVDDQDPVADNTQVTYTIRVLNEGDAADHQVQLQVEIPEGLKFASANGPTKFNQDGSTVTFDPIKTLNAGDVVDFKVSAKNNGQGNVLFKAMLTSESLNKEVVGEEPTRLFKNPSNPEF